MHFYTKYSKEKIKIAAKPFASGGEGGLYHVVSPRQYKHLVAKIYYPEKRSVEREHKIIYLIEHPPISISQKHHAPIGWPIDILYEQNKEFVGLLLPLLQGNKLTMLTLSKLSRRTAPAWQRFSLKSKEAFKLRLRLCFNIASTLYQLHNSQKYVLVDLKPDNILVQPNGLISIVDMDSVEVVEDNKVVFPAPVATPEYTPPEKYTIERNLTTPVLESWDRFSMAVIFYQLLFGLHPFAASAKAPYDKLVGLDDKIRYGLFVHNPSIQQHFATIPPPHRKFDNIDPLLKDLFLECFVAGHQQPASRPTAEEWCAYLISALNLPIQLEGINSFVQLVKNYKLPSSLIKMDRLPKIAAHLVEHIKLDKSNRFAPPERKLIAGQKIQALVAHTNAIDNTQTLTLTQQLPKVTPPAWLAEYETIENIPLLVRTTAKRQIQYTATVLLVFSLIFLGFGMWTGTFLFGITGSIVFLFTEEILTFMLQLKNKQARLLRVESELTKWEEEQPLLLDKKRTLEEQAQLTTQEILALKKEGQNPLPLGVQQYIQKIENYEQDIESFKLFIKQQDNLAKQTREEEKEAYQSTRQIYEDKIKAHPQLAKLRSTAYKYLHHQLMYKTEQAKLKIKKAEKLIFQTNEAFSRNHKTLIEDFKHQSNNSNKNLTDKFNNLINKVTQSIEKAETDYEQQKQALEADLAHQLNQYQRKIEAKISAKIRELDYTGKEVKQEEDSLGEQINSTIKKIKHKKTSIKLFKQLNSRFEEENLPISDIIQLFDKFQLPPTLLKESDKNLTDIDPLTVHEQLSNIETTTAVFLQTLQDNWLSLKQQLRKLQKKIVRNIVAIKKNYNSSLSLREEHEKMADQQLVNKANIAQNFDLIFGKLNQTPEEQEELLDKLDSYGLVSISQLKNIDVVHNEFEYKNGVILNCAKLSDVELQALNNYLESLTQDKEVLIQKFLKNGKSLSSLNSFLGQELKKFKEQLIKTLATYYQTSDRYITELKQLYVKHYRLTYQYKQVMADIEIENYYDTLVEKQEKKLRYQQQQDSLIQAYTKEQTTIYQQNITTLTQKHQDNLAQLKQRLLELKQQLKTDKLNTQETLNTQHKTAIEQLEKTFEQELQQCETTIQEQTQAVEAYEESIDFLEHEHQQLEQTINEAKNSYKEYYNNMQKQILAQYNNLKTLSIYLKNRLPQVQEFVAQQENRSEQLQQLLEQYQTVQKDYAAIQTTIAKQKALQTWQDNPKD